MAHKQKQKYQKKMKTSRNAVWESDVKMNPQGWTVEMKIPYRALRFANQEVQHWGRISLEGKK